MTSSEVVERYTGLVIDIAHQVHRRCDPSVSFDDLRSYGFLGLLQAHRRFEPERGTKFVSYAYSRIRGAVLDGLREQTWSTRHWDLDVEIRSESSPTSRAAGESLSHAGTPPTSTDTEGFDANDGNTRSLTLLLMHRLDLDAVVDGRADGQVDRVERRQQWDQIEDILDEIPDRQRHVLVEYYLQGRTMSEIADERDCSKSWVCRLRRRAFAAVREQLRERGVEIDVD